MVKIGQSSNTPRLTYLDDPLHRGGVEVITFARLRAMPAGGFAPPVQRADFHVLAIVDSGQGRVTVDFVEHRLEGHDVVWIRPGQVHCWNDVTAIAGTVVMFRPDAASGHSTIDAPYGPARWQTTPSRALVRLAAEHLRREHDALHADQMADSNVILRALLEVLLVRVLDKAPVHRETRKTFRAYAAAVDLHHATCRQVSWYARTLGYSDRTLSRATQDAVGRTAKQFVDDRVLLEAKRLLTQADITIAECAKRTGFNDAANFSKFFRSRSGLSPSEFTARLSSTTPSQ
jgi:AraC family transcriptional regulator, transcriptional activator of pobA